MFQKIKINLAVVGLLFVCLLPSLVLAQQQATIGNLLNKTADGAGYAKNVSPETGIATILGTIARAFISFVGVIFISYLIYGGGLWMSAAGNEEKVTKAKKVIRDSVIGLVVTLSAAGIYLLIKTVLLTGSMGGPMAPI